MEDQIRCPKCSSTQISANKKGWTLVTGMIGSSKIIITFLNCGNRFKPGEGKKTTNNAPKLIWDDKTKTHISNPAYKKDIQSIGCLPLTIGLIILIIILILILR